MKLFFKNALLICFLFGFFIPTIQVEAKTINSMQKELNQRKTEYEKNKKEQSNLNHNITTGQKEISNAQSEITKAEKDLIATGTKIQQLDVKIVEKNKEIDELMKAIQQTNKDFLYLEYIVSSKDLSDFIQRTTFIKELTDYNEKEIKEMNQMIAESKQLQIELKKKQDIMNNKISDLNNKITTYNVKLNDLSEIQVDVLEEIKSLQDTINYYRNKNCNPDQDIEACLKNSLPYDTAFWRPALSGYISSEYGWRTHPTTGTYKMHYGTDIAVGNRVTNVLSSAAGKVASINRNNSNSCGGNYVIVHHNIKGKEYTTAYLHMEKVYVNIGQQITKDTVLGLAGGNPYGSPGYTPWDKCSTGQHIHFSVATGLKLTIGQVENSSMNSRVFVNYPAIGSYKLFNDRTTKF